MSSQNDFRENNYEILTYEEPKKYTFEELQKLTFNEFKNLTMENLSNINSKEIDYLFQKHNDAFNLREKDKCPECDKQYKYLDTTYCEPCNSKRFSNNFSKWTSGLPEIDKMIQESQLNARSPSELVEWIPYYEIDIKEHIADGGFGSVYRAIWKIGRIYHERPWDVEKQKWIREGEKEVAIKVFRDAYTFSPEFLNESLSTVMIIVIGIFIVAILNENATVTITDFGISRPVNETLDDERRIYGVLPFIAPEVLLGEEYTKAADVYSFGMIMLEVISGEPPFFDYNFDENLAYWICDKEHPQRPQIPDYVPDPYVALIRRCWNSNPQERPIATDMRKQFQHWSVNLRGSDLSNEKDVLKIQEQKDILQAFNKNQEEKWKRRLSEISQPKFYDKLTSKYIYYTRSFSQNGHLQNKSSIQENDEHLLIIELANGGNLEHYMKGDIFNTLTWLGKIKLAKGIAEGLRFIHELGVIHRDLEKLHVFT
ncbi:kinase-like domain-containing protein [Gigaspora rosea]|uniref:Kinase-like domain-containing protein n=1 Tax=Gigaspora rosea TaxID=44941 RepID=A0A397VXW6_9GLOM|nr:kinase-like domain-containing protein [Gigaspora rosea]